MAPLATRSGIGGDSRDLSTSGGGTVAAVPTGSRAGVVEPAGPRDPVPRGRVPAANIVIGFVGRPFGRYGEVFVEPVNGDPTRFERIEAAVVAPPSEPGRRLGLASVRCHRARPVVRFSGVRTIGDAEALRGAEVRIPTSELPPLPPDRYYCDDLVGCCAESPDGRFLGKVSGVLDTAGPGLLVLRAPDGSEDLVPFVRAFCVAVDLAAKRLVLELPDGLLGLNRHGAG